MFPLIQTSKYWYKADQSTKVAMRVVASHRRFVDIFHEVNFQIKNYRGMHSTHFSYHEEVEEMLETTANKQPRNTGHLTNNHHSSSLED